MSNPREEQESAAILIVDDEPDILESLADLLHLEIPNVPIVLAADAAQALEKAAERPFFLVISDYRMPGKDGLQLLGEMRKKYPNVARIMMTAYPDLNVAVEAINSAKIQDFLMKPLDPARFIEIVTETLQNRNRKVQRDRAFARALSHRAGGKQ